MALIVNELVTNAIKHASPNRDGEHICVRLVQPEANTALISVRDNGVPLPADFDPGKSKGLGMRIVTALAKQLGASITQHARVDGNEFALLVPCDRIGES